MKSDDINGTHEQLFKITLQTHNQIEFGIHFHTNIYITLLILLTSRDRAEKTQCPHSELAFEFIGVSLDEFDVFVCLLHLYNTYYNMTRLRLSVMQIPFVADCKSAQTKGVI